MYLSFLPQFFGFFWVVEPEYRGLSKNYHITFKEKQSAQVKFHDEQLHCPLPLSNNSSSEHFKCDGVQKLERSILNVKLGLPTKSHYGQQVFVLFFVVVFVFFVVLMLFACGDIELNPGPKKSSYYNFSVCHWNSNSLIAHNF